MTFEEYRVIVPRLHEEIADLRRQIGIYEEALEEIDEECDGKAHEIANEALFVGQIKEYRPSPWDDEHDPGDETD